MALTRSNDPSTSEPVPEVAARVLRVSEAKQNAKPQSVLDALADAATLCTVLYPVQYPDNTTAVSTLRASAEGETAAIMAAHGLPDYAFAYALAAARAAFRAVPALRGER